jgi:DNA-binding Xre family transcriptional regulator
VEPPDPGARFDRALVDIIRAAIKRTGTRWEDLADSADVSRATLGRILASKPGARVSELRASTLYKLCAALGLDIRDVVDEAERIADE